MRIIQVVGYKNSGKTTLVEKLTKRFSSVGYDVGTIKHDQHPFEIDHAGTDTYRHREAGAKMTAITSIHRTALLMEQSVELDELLRQMFSMDIVFVEGFKGARHAKIVMIREPEDVDLVSVLEHVVAAVVWPESEEVWDTLSNRFGIQLFHRDDIAQIYDWVLDHLGVPKKRRI